MSPGPAARVRTSAFPRTRPTPAFLVSLFLHHLPECLQNRKQKQRYLFSRVKKVRCALNSLYRVLTSAIHAAEDAVLEYIKRVRKGITVLVPR